MTPDQGILHGPDKQEGIPEHFTDYLLRNQALSVDNRLFIRYSRTRTDQGRQIRLPELKIIAPSSYSVTSLFDHGLSRNMVTNYQDGIGVTRMMMFPALEGIEVGKYMIAVRMDHSPEGVPVIGLTVESPDVMGHAKFSGVRTGDIVQHLREDLAAGEA